MTWSEAKKYYSENITEEIITYVLQVKKEGAGFRELSNLVDEKFPGFVLHPGNQIDGMFIQEIAENYEV